MPLHARHTHVHIPKRACTDVSFTRTPHAHRQHKCARTDGHYTHATRKHTRLGCKPDVPTRRRHTHTPTSVNMHWCASSRTTHASTSTYTCTQVLSTRNNRHSHLSAHALRYTYTHITRTQPVRTCYAPTCPPHARQSSSFACTDVHVHERTRAHTCLDGMHRRPYTHATQTYNELGDHSQMYLYTHGASIHVNLGAHAKTRYLYAQCPPIRFRCTC